MTLSELRAAESEWWFPKVIDTAYCDRLRRDYPEDADLDDDSIREKYGCTGKYNKPSLWDHTGDAEEDYERLADEYLKLRDHILIPLERLETP